MPPKDLRLATELRHLQLTEVLEEEEYFSPGQKGISAMPHTRNPVLRGALRMMRRPAQAAGLGDLQRFLEAGFDTFGAMRGAGEFLGLVREREQALCVALFASTAVTSVTEASTDAPTGFAPVLGQLP